MYSQRQQDIELGARNEGRFQAGPIRPRQERTIILYEEELPPEFSGPNLPIELAKRRNHTIRALQAQAIAAVAGYGFFFFRRLWLYFVVNTISLIFVYYGFQGTLKLQKWKVAAHSVATMGILGSCWIYFIMEALFYSKTKTIAGETHQSERAILFLLALPYLVDLVCGAISFTLTYHLLKLEETQDRLLRRSALNEEVIQADENYDPNSANCCVCLNFKKSCVIYPCGHLALCNYCARDFKTRNIKKCPLCAAIVKDIIQTYS